MTSPAVYSTAAPETGKQQQGDRNRPTNSPASIRQKLGNKSGATRLLVISTFIRRTGSSLDLNGAPGP